MAFDVELIAQAREFLEKANTATATIDDSGNIYFLKASYAVSAFNQWCRNNLPQILDEVENLKNQNDELHDNLTICHGERLKYKKEVIAANKCADTNQKLYNIGRESREKVEQENAALKARVEELDGKYNDLIMWVSKKHKGETRHETAKRYIIQSESHVDEPCKSEIKKDGGNENNT